MSKVKVGGSNFAWNEVETDFKYAKEVSKVETILIAKCMLQWE